MASRKKTNLKIIGATAVGLFSLTSLFTGTLAWFSMNQSVSTTGMTVRVKSISSIISKVTIHNSILDITTSSVIQFENTPIATINIAGAGNNSMASATIDIDDYSELYPTKPVLFLFTLIDGVKNEDINLFAKTNESIVDIVEEEDVNKTPLSSAVWFKSAAYTNASFPFNNVVVNDLSSTAQFADYSAATPTFNNSITLYSGTGSAIVKYVAVVMEYETTAIETIKANNTQIALEYDRIGFYCDWIMEM